MSLNTRSKDIVNMLRSKHDQDDLDVAITDILVTSLETDSLAAVSEAVTILLSSSVNILESTALSVVPLLLRPAFRNPVARDILHLVGLNGNPREVIMAAQEALGQTYHGFMDADVDEEDAEEALSEIIPLVVDLLDSSISRVILRKKSALETLRPLFRDISQSVNAAAQHGSEHTNGRVLVSCISGFVGSAYQWASIASPDGINLCRDALTDFLLETVSTCSAHLNSLSAEREFGVRYPRYGKQAPVALQDWQSGEKAVQAALHAYPLMWEGEIGTLVEIIRNKETSSSIALGAMILVAHSDFTPPLSSLNDDIIRQNVVLALTSAQGADEALAFLIRATSNPSTEDRVASSRINEDSLTSLVQVLTPLASLHPNPTTRHLVFRLLSTLISLADDSALTLCLLVELIRDCPFPQMQTASIGLLRQMVVQALQDAHRQDADAVNQNVLASPVLLQQVSPFLLCPQPLDLFEGGAGGTFSLKEFVNSPEPARLTEALGFYYVLVEGDTRNLTGVRSPDHTSKTKRDFLDPLTATLEQDAGASPALIPLQMALERVNEALAKL